MKAERLCWKDLLHIPDREQRGPISRRLHMQPELRPPLNLGLQYSQPEKEFFYLKVLTTTLIFPSIPPRLLHFNLVSPQIKILHFIKPF